MFVRAMANSKECLQELVSIGKKFSEIQGFQEMMLAVARVYRK